MEFEVRELDSVGGYVQIAAPKMILQPLVNALRFSTSSNRQKQYAVPGQAAAPMMSQHGEFEAFYSQGDKHVPNESRPSCRSTKPV